MSPGLWILLGFAAACLLFLLGALAAAEVGRRDLRRLEREAETEA